MTIHNLYIFDQNGTLLYYGEWDRTQYSGLSVEEVGDEKCFNIILFFHYCYVALLLNLELL